MDLVVMLLRLAHIGAGVFWVGAAFTMLLFVQPTLEALGGQTQQAFMQHINKQRRLLPTTVAAAFITVAAGAALYWISSGGLAPAWLGSQFGLGITIGALAALTAFVLLVIILVPAFSRMGKLGMEVASGGGPPTAEQAAEVARIGQRLKRTGMLILVLLALAVSFMAIARYM